MSDLMFIAIAYDTPSDRRRRRVVRLLDDIAQRVQFSVYEGWITQRDLELTITRLQQVIDPTTDKIRIYRLCTYCRNVAHRLGPGQDVIIPEVWLV